MKILNPFQVFVSAFLALIHAVRGTPLSNARERHLEAVRAAYRVHAELTYHDHLIEYFDKAARGMDPHDDWNLFAQLKDKWNEHSNERKLEAQKFERASARMKSSAARLVKLENQA